MFLEELGAAIKEAGLENEFMIYEIKEKYGQNRLYHSGGTKEIDDIIDKYECLSENICVSCGKPDVPMINDGWFSPWCFDCWKKDWRSREEYRDNVKLATDEEIMDAYKKCICDDDPNMPDTITRRIFSNDNVTTMTIDISDTANKIRKRWERRHKHENIKETN